MSRLLRSVRLVLHLVRRINQRFLRLLLICRVFGSLMLFPMFIAAEEALLVLNGFIPWDE